MIDWIAEHPQVVIWTVEALAITAFLIFMTCLSWSQHKRSVAADKAHQRVMSSFRRTTSMIGDAVDRIDEEEERRLH